MSVTDAAHRPLELDHSPAAVACSHCGLDVPAGLVEEGAPEQFCCNGCRTAWDILHRLGLDSYYRLGERREAAVVASGRRFEEFDHAAFHQLYVRRRGDGLAETRLYLEDIHCASCVWLVERVPLAVPGVASAELDVARSLVRIAWDAEATPLSAVARFLDTLGYRPRPFRGIEAEERRRAEDRAMIVRIGVAGAIAGNVMTIAMALYSGWLSGMDPAHERFFRWLSLILTTPAVFWPGRLFFQGAWSSLRARVAHMDLPIAIALGAGYARGAINTLTDRGPIYFDGVAALIFLLLVGRFLQQRAQRAAADASELLHSLSPSTARVVEPGGEVREVPAEALLPGMLIEVRPGDTFPADGVVTRGRSDVETAFLTGESRPVAVAEDERVWAGALNRTAPLRVQVEEAGEASRLGRLLREVESASRRRAPVVRLADRLAGAFVLVVLGLALATWIGWRLAAPAHALDHAIALLIVTCPCALALATPLAITVAVGRAARAGILVKGGDALEALGRPGVLVLDKTGTVTEGRTELIEWEGPEWVKPLVLALERDSTHPIAAGFQSAWRGVAAPAAEDVEHIAGGGIAGRVAGRAVIVGTLAHLRERLGRTIAAPVPARALTPVHVAVDGALVARAGFGDRIRADAPAALARLRARGWRLRLLSGDDPAVVAEVGRALGFAPEECRGGATPEEKRSAIEASVAERPTVMVGDGVNDAAAIARATVGIGVRGGAEACLASADVFLARGGLEPLVRLVEGSERALGLIRRGIGFSIAYNLVGVGLAVTGVINPLIAAILMPLSSLTVVLVAWRGRTFDAAGEGDAGDAERGGRRASRSGVAA